MYQVCKAKITLSCSKQGKNRVWGRFDQQKFVNHSQTQKQNNQTDMQIKEQTNDRTTTLTQDRSEKIKRVQN